MIAMAASKARRRWTALFALTGLLALGWAAGCSNILGIDSNRYVDAGVADTSVREAAMEAGIDAGNDVVEAAAKTGPWDCLGQAPQQFSPNAMTTVTFLAVNALDPITQGSVVDGGSALQLVTYTPYPNVMVRGCSSVLDPLCDNGTATSWETTDDAGTVSFTLPQSWNGFYEMQNPALITTSYYPGQMIAGQTSTTVAGTLVSLIGFQDLEAVTPVNVSLATDGGVGHVFATVYDCQDHFASGVAFVPGSIADGGFPTTVFYTLGTPGEELPSTTATATDQSGTGGILNAPVGGLLVSAVLQATPSTPAQTVGSVEIFINPGVAALLTIRARTD